jgi:PBP1b-binding outer membrane lipoprotein LpoB
MKTKFIPIALIAALIVTGCSTPVPVSEPEYDADNPYVEPKTTNVGFNNQITITCTKGKTTKKITGLTPRCPKGFKKT